MALAIDTRYLLDRWIPDQEDYLDAFVGSKGRFQLHRVCAYATIVQNSSSQHWDDLDDEVDFHDLEHNATTATTLVASVQSPAFLARVQGLPQNLAYQRYSVKMNIMDDQANGPKIVWASATDRSDLSVVWHIQLDFVDLLSPILSILRPTSKRRRTLCEEDSAEVKKRITKSDEGAGDVGSSSIGALGNF